jgi:hypothetical protein
MQKLSVLITAFISFVSFHTHAQNHVHDHSPVNQCVIELQYQGTVLGQNVFVDSICKNARKECRKTKRRYEKEHLLPKLRCQRLDIPNTRPNNPNPVYTRMQALSDLEVAEAGSRSQAQQNFDMILDSVEQGIISLYDGTQLVIGLLQVDHTKTREIQGLYRKIMAIALTSQVDPFLLGQEMLINTQIEKNVSQPTETLQLVVTHNNDNKVHVLDGMQAFNLLLGASDKSKTNEVREAYKKLVAANIPSMFRAAKNFTKIRPLENNDKDAMENTILVAAAASIQGVSYAEALQTMVELLQKYGSGETNTVQAKFKKIFRL